MLIRSFLLLVAASPLAACAMDRAGPPAAAPLADAAAEDARLLAFLDRIFDENMAQSPEALTGLGLKQDYGRLNDYTDAAAVRQQRRYQAQLARMKAEFDPARLGPDGRLNYRLFEDSVAASTRAFEWRWHQFAISNNNSPASDIPVFLINQHRVDSVADAEAYISRLREVERVMGEIGANMRRQAEMGIVPPQFAFAPVRGDAGRVISGAPFDGGADSTLLADFRKKVTALDVPAAEKARLIEAAAAALTGPFSRGYRSFLAALDAIEPKATSNDGVWRLPQGDAYYAAQLRSYTTIGLGADEIHAIGLTEVARIQAEMEKIKEKVGFKGTLQDFFAHVKTDAKFLYPNSDAGREQYLKDGRAFIAQAMAAAPRYFHRLPKAPLEMRRVEPWREQTASGGFYNVPSADGSRPGIYYTNLANMTQVLGPQLEPTAYHEGAPGHHFQMARAQELEGVPKFRRFSFNSAYGEGWGLYAERLAKEMGFYKDPYSEFGMLSLELWRAARLVVDTGVHAKRWSRERAIDYLLKNSLLSDAKTVREIHRYIAWPGQATSYKIGQLKIIALRRKAEDALGARFDIRDFHEAVLGAGSLPLDMLEERVDAYIAAARR